MKQINLVCQVEVQPLDDGEGENSGMKQLVFTDPQCGEVVTYKMDPELSKKMSGLLKMSNKSLLAKIEEEQRQAQARALLDPGANGQSAEAIARQVISEQQRGHKN